MNSEINNIQITNLHLDKENPRLVEFGINKQSSEKEILTVLWDEMSVNELMYSIVSNNFWEYEPLIAIKENKSDFIIIEGNRRLAAVKLIHNSKSIDRKINEEILDKITPELVDSTNSLPVIIAKNREDAWQFIGFKHVNGPTKWGSFAKAKYIAEIHNLYNVPISEIAFQIGDTNNTAQKLYQGYMVLEEAQNKKVYSLDEVQANRIYFSHLYTGLQREGIRDFLNISAFDAEEKSPVPDDNLKELRELLVWLFGSKKDDLQAVIRSQNPDLKYLDEVVKNKESIQSLRSDGNLSYAYELSRPSDSIFEESLFDAKRKLQKARAYVTEGFNGEESLLKLAGSTANIADDLYEEMERIYKLNSPDKKNRRIE